MLLALKTQHQSESLGLTGAFGVALDRDIKQLDDSSLIIGRNRDGYA